MALIGWVWFESARIKSRCQKSRRKLRIFAKSGRQHRATLGRLETLQPARCVRALSQRVPPFSPGLAVTSGPIAKLRPGAASLWPPSNVPCVCFVRARSSAAGCTPLLKVHRQPSADFRECKPANRTPSVPPALRPHRKPPHTFHPSTHLATFATWHKLMLEPQRRNVTKPLRRFISRP